MVGHLHREDLFAQFTSVFGGAVGGQAVRSTRTTAPLCASLLMLNRFHPSCLSVSPRPALLIVGPLGVSRHRFSFSRSSAASTRQTCPLPHDLALLPRIIVVRATHARSLEMPYPAGYHLRIRENWALDVWTFLEWSAPGACWLSSLLSFTTACISRSVLDGCVGL